jgi:hypothetical protein
MMKSEDRWETDRELGIEAALKIARGELIRRNIMKLIFEKVTNQLVHIT